jgi:hypothetical protein
MPEITTSQNLQDLISKKLVEKNVQSNLQNIRDFKKYEKLTSDNPNLTVDYKPLNFDLLQKIGALRVTHQGLDEGYNPDPKAGFSLVSGYNDAVGPSTRGWKNNPIAYPVVREMFEQRPNDIGAHKYLQIIESAKDLGLSDKDIYLKQ